MPGVSKDRVHLRVDGDQLTLEGEMSLAVPQGMAPTHAEVQRSRYRRAFTLSKELDAEKVSAEMNQGVLRVRIPKAEHAQPRRVQVEVR
jgi:HSP20 family molecular chaperone IbpA